MYDACVTDVDVIASDVNPLLAVALALRPKFVALALWLSGLGLGLEPQCLALALSV